MYLIFSEFIRRKYLYKYIQMRHREKTKQKQNNNKKNNTTTNNKNYE